VVEQIFNDSLVFNYNGKRFKPSAEVLAQILNDSVAFSYKG
jgi:hypothetical protein